MANDNEKDELKQYSIHQNAFRRGFFWGLPVRNYVELVLFGGIFYLILKSIPFVEEVRHVFYITSLLPLLTLLLLGVKGRSFFPFICSCFRFYKQKDRKYHLRSVYDAETKKAENIRIQNDNEIKKILRKILGGKKKKLHTGPSSDRED